MIKSIKKAGYVSLLFSLIILVFITIPNTAKAQYYDYSYSFDVGYGGGYYDNSYYSNSYYYDTGYNNYYL